MRYIVAILALVALVILYLITGGVGPNILGETELHPAGQGLKTDRASTPRNEDLFKPKLDHDPVDDLFPADPEEIFEKPSGIAYKSIDQLEYEPELMKQVREELDNFRKYGSIGKGLTTIEFAKTQDLKESLNQKGLHSILNGLAFNPVHMTSILGSEFKLVGANDQGKLINGRGWNGYFQALSDENAVRQIELSESQIETKLGDGAEVISEFLNEKIGDVPASVQAMRDAEGRDVLSIQWSDDERMFTLNTKSFEKPEALALATSVLERYRLLPYQGWKSPYILDPSNALHRVAIQRDRQNAK